MEAQLLLLYAVFGARKRQSAAQKKVADLITLYFDLQLQ